MSDVLVVGGFDPDFPRNRQILDLLDRAGHRVDARPVSVWRSPLPEVASRRSIRLAAHAFVGLLRVASEALRAPRPDVLLVLHPSQFDALVLCPIAWLRRVPVVVDLFISLQDTVVEDRDLVSRRSLLGRLTGLLDRLSASAATIVLADTPQHAAALADRTGARQDRFRVLWVGADPDRFQPAPYGSARDDLVLFYGTYIPLHGTEVIVRAAALLADSGTTFRMIGEGQDRAATETLARELGAPVEFVDPVPEEELADEIRAAAVCLGIFGSSRKASRVVPNKVFQCLAMGRPVVTADTGTVRQALGDAVVRVPIDDPPALAGAVRALMADRPSRERLAAVGPRLLGERFSREVLRTSLDRYLEEATTARSRRARRRRG